MGRAPGSGKTGEGKPKDPGGPRMRMQAPVAVTG